MATSNDPETAIYGYLDGMGTAILTGSAWQGLHATVPGARPLPERAVVLVSAVGSLTGGLYLHVDLDVVDIEEARVNVYSAPGGVTADQLEALVGTLLEEFPVQAVSLTAYDPECDPEGRVPAVAMRRLRLVALRLRSC